MTLLYGFACIPIAFVLIWLSGKVITRIEPHIDEWVDRWRK